MADSASAARLAKIPSAVKHVHLIGVAGTAMAALAGMLTERGYRVTGSDNQLYEPTASLLRNSRVEVVGSFAAANLTLAPDFIAPDLVIVGNVIPRINPEAVALLRTEIPYLSMPEALWHFFLKNHRVLMVAGTHGKTTSTAMMAHVLESAGRDPSMLVGGVAKDFGSNYRLGRGEDFVIEGDEYDTAFFDKGPKFLHYRASGAIITAVEFDHADIYRDLEHVKASFRALAAQMDSSRVLALCADFPHALEVASDARARRITFGLRGGEFQASDVEVGADGAKFSITRDGARVVAQMHLPIGGRMNVANALGVYVLLNAFGVRDDEIAHGFRTFKGVVRRQEIIGEAAGVTVVDDFAHHPTAIGVTLEAIAERFPGRRILAAFEPRSNTARRNVFQRGFASAFSRASRVYLGPVYFKENDPIPEGERLDTGMLASEISSHGAAAMACASNDEILERMLDDARAGDVALFMSNGPFDGLKEKFLAALKGRE
ncbi:MAG: Mur ligase family protein [Candidatus Binatus sp.]|uniref:UDP-N-acetylmuramate--L-alanine ligase n=1 Tax=Candidatus Binatus sp. TaxID=2811406 RepID=UPI002720C6D8|nr:Mur ligase family protein [Candidatus Binatus sp.]MDO8433532.1 Mur ligase family protein [Candidatus Binatus sp.]